MKNSNIKELASIFTIVLGSGSPRRQRLMKELGVNFEQVTPEVEEVVKSNEEPYAFAKRLAEEKSLAVSGKIDAESLVIGCDTIVVLGNEVIGKPADPQDAVMTLGRLAGKSHVVCTALAFALRGKILSSDYELTEVKFNEVSLEQIGNYVASGEPLDKAGAYGIQGMGAFLVDSISGNLDNVIGFPRLLLENMAGEVLTSIRKQDKGA